MLHCNKGSFALSTDADVGGSQEEEEEEEEEDDEGEGEDEEDEEEDEEDEEEDSRFLGVCMDGDVEDLVALLEEMARAGETLTPQMLNYADSSGRVSIGSTIARKMFVCACACVIDVRDYFCSPDGDANKR